MKQRRWIHYSAAQRARERAAPFATTTDPTTLVKAAGQQAASLEAWALAVTPDMPEQLEQVVQRWPQWSAQPMTWPLFPGRDLERSPAGRYPWEAGNVVPLLADVWGEPAAEVAQRMGGNFRRLLSSIASEGNLLQARAPT